MMSILYMEIKMLGYLGARLGSTLKSLVMILLEVDILFMDKVLIDLMKDRKNFMIVLVKMVVR